MTRVNGEDDFEAVDFAAAVHDSGENSDGWIDTGNGKTAAGPQRHDLIDVGSTDAPDTQTSASDSGTARKPSTNNPFLRQKSRESADIQPIQPESRRYTAAWAELIPSSSNNNDDVAGASQSAAWPPFDGNASAPAHAAKGKAPADDDAAFEPPAAFSRQASSLASPSSGYLSRAASLPPPPPRNQTYTIKHVRWLDHSAGDSVRTTPILMQNLNGPCPLLALVNALTMSTPRGTRPPVHETLRTREQVSLNLLLNAVVEELMSGRAGEQGDLPDMADLYEFLMALHTGMNVNPKFVPDEESLDLIDFEPRSPGHGKKNMKGGGGGFEATKEMKLYGTFAVPLVHGWLPPESHPAYGALKRSANTHEDAENLLTREDELEEKLAAQGLSEDEQRVLEDISSIKYFLSSSATQLTEHGLQAIQDAMKPGGFTILFRNNHFSTLYKHPLTGHVFSLVTDMGFAKYDEIVWESLVDINGAGAELFSGDFRVVSHGTETGVQERRQEPQQDSQSWTTVDRSNRNVRRKPIEPSGQPPGYDTNADSADTHAQEDADLALALQLQEEEEERHRRQDTPHRPPQTVPPRGPSTGQVPQQQQQQQQQSSPSQQQQQQQQQQFRQRRGNPAFSSTPVYGVWDRTPGRPSQLTIRTNNPPSQHGIFQDISASSSTSNVDRPLRGSQANNSPFPAAPAPRSRRAHPDPDGPSDEAPPPTYESALEETPYIPPENSAHHHTSPLPSPSIGHPSIGFPPPPPPPSASRSGPLPVNFDDVIARAQAGSDASRRNQTPIQGNSIYAPSPTAARTRRRSSGVHTIGPERREKEKECVVM